MSDWAILGKLLALWVGLTAVATLVCCGISYLAGSQPTARAAAPIPARPLVNRLETYKVYDGDTLTDCTIDLGYGVVLRDSVRIIGVDTPEVTGTSAAAGRVVRDKAAAWLAAQGDLWLIGRGREKYGRILGDVLPAGSDQTLSQWLLANGYAKPLGEDGLRAQWTKAELDAITGS